MFAGGLLFNWVWSGDDWSEFSASSGNIMLWKHALSLLFVNTSSCQLQSCHRPRNPSKLIRLHLPHFSYSRACTSAWDTCGVRVCFSCLSLWEQRPPRARPSPGGELRHKKAETRLLRPPRCRNWHAGASARQRGCCGQLSLGRVGGREACHAPQRAGHGEDRERRKDPEQAVQFTRALITEDNN